MINGIQHIGIGVKDRDKSYDFYKNAMDFSVPLSKNTGNCTGMIPVIKHDEQRNVVIALNPYGGGLIEIFQYITKEPVPPKDYDFSSNGYLFFGLKVRNIRASMEIIKNHGGIIINNSKNSSLKDSTTKESAPNEFTPDDFTPMKSFGWKTAIFRDIDGIYGILLEYPESNIGYGKGKPRIGGVEYVAVGVSNLENSIDFYTKIMGYTKIVYKADGNFPEWDVLFGKGRKMKRALLMRDRKPEGIFRHFLRGGMIELIEVEGNNGKHMFDGRKWGDIGLMELCFDVTDIDKTLKEVTDKGAEMIVPPYRQDMGMNTYATFAYIKDPDGSMLEFADVHRLPVPYFFIRTLVNPPVIHFAKNIGLL